MFKKIALGAAALLMALLPVAKVSAEVSTVNLIANPSMETAAVTTAPDSWLASTWGTNTTAFSYETTGRTGKSVKANVTAYTSGDSKWAFTPVNITGSKTYYYSHWYMSNVDTQIDAEITDTAGVISHQYITAVTASPSAWTQVTGQFVAPANAKSVVFYQAINKVGYVQIDDASLNLFTPSQLNRALVSVTFDDTWRNQYTAGKPVLDKYGVKATFYALTNTFEYSDYMTQAMLTALQADGQEIASHTVDHEHLITMTAAQVDKELADSKTALQALLGTTAAKNFATPFGEYNDTVVAAAKKYYKSHRSTDVGYNAKDTINMYNIKVQNILDGTKPAEVAAWIAQAQADKTWLVLVYHGVEADPSASVEDYSVTAANLDAELSIIKQSGIAIATMDQAIDEINAQLGTVTPPVVVLKPGDANGDSAIDALDLSLVLANWNKPTMTRAQGDLNADGVIDALDLSILLANWSK